MVADTIKGCVCVCSTDCAAGKYSGSPGATSGDVCTDCGAGKYSTSSGATDMETCTDCPIDTYSGSAGSTGCTACASGKLNANTGLTCLPSISWFLSTLDLLVFVLGCVSFSLCLDHSLSRRI